MELSGQESHRFFCFFFSQRINGHGMTWLYPGLFLNLPHNRKKQFGSCANVTWPHSPCFIYHSIPHVLKVVLFLSLFVLIVKSGESQRKNWGKCNGDPTVTKSFSQ